MPHSAAGWRIEPPVSVPVAAGAMRAATAAAEPPDEPPGTARVIPGVLHRAEEAGFVGGAHGELVHVGLAQADHAGGLELADHMRVVGRDEVRQHFRAAGGEPALGAENILVGDRHAGQRPGLAGARQVGLACLFQGLFRSTVMKALRRAYGLRFVPVMPASSIGGDPACFQSGGNFFAKRRSGCEAGDEWS